MDGKLIGSSIGFIFSEFVDMDGPFFSEYLNDFAFSAFSTSSKNDNFVLFADGKWSNPVFLSEIFRESRTHDSVSNMRRSGEMGSSLFSTTTTNLNVSLHHKL